jgi:hypothetical protein
MLRNSERLGSGDEIGAVGLSEGESSINNSGKVKMIILEGKTIESL